MSNTVNNYTETDLGNISLNPRGEYDSSVEYEYLDAVSYQGGSYFCLAELETTITGIAPDAGRNSEHWQMIAAPGDMTPEYTAAYNNVINKAVQVEESRAAVELAQQEIEAVQTDVQQLHSDTVQTAQEAENSKNSAADSAQSAEQSRKTASESERNINGQIAGFDSRVSEAVEQSKEEINTTKQQAINTITKQQTTSVNTVKTEGEKIITRVGNDAKTVADDRATVEEATQTVLNNAQEVARNAQIVAGNTENAAASAESAKTSADNAAQSAKGVEDASKQIEQNKKDVDSLKEDIVDLKGEYVIEESVSYSKNVNEIGYDFNIVKNAEQSLSVLIDEYIGGEIVKYSVFTRENNGGWIARISDATEKIFVLQGYSCDVVRVYVTLRDLCLIDSKMKIKYKIKDGELDDIKATLYGKQDMLIAGNGIDIASDGKTISVIGIDDEPTETFIETINFSTKKATNNFMVKLSNFSDFTFRFDTVYKITLTQLSENVSGSKVFLVIRENVSSNNSYIWLTENVTATVNSKANVIEPIVGFNLDSEPSNGVLTGTIKIEYSATRKEHDAVYGKNIMILGDSYSEEVPRSWNTKIMLSHYESIRHITNVARGSATLKDKSDNREVNPYYGLDHNYHGSGIGANENTMLSQVERVKRLHYGTDLHDDEFKLPTWCYPDIILLEFGKNDSADITENYFNSLYDLKENVYVDSTLVSKMYIKKEVDSIVRTNICGAIAVAYEELRKLYPNAKIFFITPSGLMYLGTDKQQQYILISNQIRESCELLSIPTINWDRNCEPVNNFNVKVTGDGTKENPYKIVKNVNETSDGMHPTEQWSQELSEEVYRELKRFQLLSN